MQFLDREIWKYGGTVLQAEDEIAGIGAVVGRLVRRQESHDRHLRPRHVAEDRNARPGQHRRTAAGLRERPARRALHRHPTKAEQSDLFQAAFSAHGDCLRPVLAPDERWRHVRHHRGSLQPRGVLPDARSSCCRTRRLPSARRPWIRSTPSSSRSVERRRPTEAELANYARFKLTESGISPISHPGMPGGNYLAAGIEHNELGRPTASGEMHARMNEKRFRKFNPLKSRRDLFEVEGDPDAPIGLVSWGSVAGVAREALRLAQAEGLRAKLLVPKLLYPVAEPIYQDFFASVRRGLFIEQSYQAQLYRLVRMYVDFPALVKPLAKSGSNPIRPAEVLERLRANGRRHPRQSHQHPEPFA